MPNRLKLFNCKRKEKKEITREKKKKKKERKKEKRKKKARKRQKMKNYLDLVVTGAFQDGVMGF